MNLMDKSEEIIKEARRLEEDITYSAKARYNISNFYYYIHWIFGSIIISLTIIIGSESFIGLKIQFLISSLSLTVIVLSMLQVFYNPSEKYQVNKHIGDEYNKLKQKIRIFYNIELYENDLEENKKTIKRFAEEKGKLDYNSSPVLGWFYNRAKKGIEKGEHEYKVDD